MKALVYDAEYITSQVGKCLVVGVTFAHCEDVVRFCNLLLSSSVGN